MDAITFCIGIPWACQHCGGQIQQGTTPSALPYRDHPKIKALYAGKERHKFCAEMQRLYDEAVSS
jgi:hypothetical protein